MHHCFMPASPLPVQSSVRALLCPHSHKAGGAKEGAIRSRSWRGGWEVGRGLAKATYPHGSSRGPGKQTAQALSLHTGCSKVHKAHRLPGPRGHFGLQMAEEQGTGSVSPQMPKSQASPFGSVLSLETGNRGGMVEKAHSGPQRNTMPASSCWARKSGLRRGWVACAQRGPLAGLLGSVGWWSAIVQGNCRQRWAAISNPSPFSQAYLGSA